MSNDVIRVEKVFKEYRLGMVGTGTLSRDLQSFWARIRGKEDPNSIITRHSANTSRGDREELRQHILALNDVSFNLKKGEILGIIGSNGSGKSTLLKIISKITTPTKGEIKVKGRIGALLEVGTGFHPELTGIENIYLNGAILGMKRAEIKGKLDEILNFAEIEKFADTPVKRYSSGMYVRLAFAVAAHLEPEIMIVDEVLAVGDAQFQKKCLGKMEQVSSKDGRTVLFVSHNMVSIKQLCSRCICLSGGRIVEDGAASRVVDAYLSRTLSGDANPAERKFKNDPSKEFQVLSVKMLDSNGKVSREFDCDQPVTIEIDCVSRSAIPGLYGGVDIVNNEGVTVMVSDTYDFPPNCVDSLSPSNYKIRIAIPPRTLGHGEYTVSLGFHGAHSPYIFPPQFVCSFRLSDNSSQRGNTRAGYLSTLLKWEIKKA